MHISVLWTHSRLLVPDWLRAIAHSRSYEALGLLTRDAARDRGPRGDDSEGAALY